MKLIPSSEMKCPKFGSFTITIEFQFVDSMLFDQII